MRKKVSFMIEIRIIRMMEEYIPKKQWNKFMNEALEEALERYIKRKNGEISSC